MLLLRCSALPKMCGTREPGEAIGSFYGYKINGFDADGNFIFADTDNNGSVDANDKVILGNPIPDLVTD